MDDLWEYLNEGLREVASASCQPAERLVYNWQNEESTAEWDRCLLLRHEMLCYTGQMRICSHFIEHIRMAYLFRQWRNNVRWHHMRKGLTRTRKLDRLLRRRGLISKLESACEESRTKEVWWLARRLAGTNRGVKNGSL